MPGPTHPTGGPWPRVAKGNLVQAHRAGAKVAQLGRPGTRPPSLGRAALEGAGGTHRIGRKVRSGRPRSACGKHASRTLPPGRPLLSSDTGTSEDQVRVTTQRAGASGAKRMQASGREPWWEDAVPAPAWAQGSSAWKTAMTGSSWVVTTRTLRNLSKSMSSCERRVFSLYMISSRWWRPRK